MGSVGVPTARSAPFPTLSCVPSPISSTVPGASVRLAESGETIELMEKIHEIRDRFKLTILLIEHNMELVMGICERIVVLNFGKTIAQGGPEEVRSNPVVIEAYLGEPVENVEV